MSAPIQVCLQTYLQYYPQSHNVPEHSRSKSDFSGPSCPQLRPRRQGSCASAQGEEEGEGEEGREEEIGEWERLRQGVGEQTIDFYIAISQSRG